MAKEVPLEDVWPTPALLRAARGLVGLVQEEVARESGISRKSLILVENHTAATMDTRRVEMVEILANYFTTKRNIEFMRARGSKGAGVRFARC